MAQWEFMSLPTPPVTLAILPSHMFSHLNILVLGDLMLDHYIWGDATRISPEAPVPVVHVDRDSYVPGGAANVAANLHGLKVDCSLLGAYAEDEGGAKLEELLSAQGISLERAGKSSAPTIVKTRLVVQRQQMCRIDREAPPREYNLAEQLDTETLVELMKGTQALLISDYAKGVITQELLDQLIEAAAQLQPKPLLLMDPKPKRQLKLQGLDLLTPNRHEALQMAGIPEDPHEAFPSDEVALRLYELTGIPQMVITLGEDGMLLCEKGQVLEHLPTEAQEVFDVSGAGDTVVATLAAALADGRSLGEAARLANRAAGVVIRHVGTYAIQAEELI